jgi:hypothetical protein
MSVKKISTLLLVSLCTTVVYGNYNFELLKRENVTIVRDAHASPRSNQVACDDEYNAFDDYEEHVCDHVQLPAISSLQAYLTEIVGSLYYQAVVVQHMASFYFAELKQLISKWLTVVIKK